MATYEMEQHRKIGRFFGFSKNRLSSSASAGTLHEAAKPRTKPNSKDISKDVPFGLKVSHGIAQDVQNALDAGVSEPLVRGLVSAAACRVQQEGRSKIGHFGSGKGLKTELQAQTKRVKSFSDS